MKKRFIKIVLAILSALLLLILGQNRAQASYLNGNDYASMANRYVVITRKKPVYRCKTGTCEAKNHFYKAGHVRRGQRVWISHWLMSTGSCWIIKGGRFYHNCRTFFAVPGYKANWYRRIR